MLKSFFTAVSLFIVIVLITSCNGNSGSLDEKSNQVNLSIKIIDEYTHIQNGYLYPEEEIEIEVTANNVDKLPEKTTYLYTFIQTSGGNYFYEREHVFDRAVSFDDWEEFYFENEGTYTLRCDLYDSDDYRLSGVMAPRFGTVEYHFTVRAIKVDVEAKLIGEGTYSFTPKILNPEIGPVIWGYRFNFGDGEYKLLFPDDAEFITHEYKNEGTYPVKVETLVSHGGFDHTIATNNLNVSVLGTEFYIEVPDTPLKTGQEYTLKAMTSGLLPASPSYEWDFGDGTGLTVPLSNETTHAFKDPGTYSIRVEVFESDEENAPLLGTATVGVVAEQQAKSIIEAYQGVKHIDVNIHTWVLWRYEEDKKPSPSADDVTFGDVGVNFKASSSENEIIWKGTEFEITTSDESFSGKGQISNDGSELVYLDVMTSWDSGTRGSASYTLRNIPLTKFIGINGSPDSVEFTNQFGYYSFEFGATGTGVELYVSTQSHHSEYDSTDGIVAKNFESWDPDRADKHSFKIIFYVTQGD